MKTALITGTSKGIGLETALAFGRAGLPEEMAKTIVFLCSEEASYITGTTLTADGGLTLTM